ncbi:MAG: MFS transporter [Puniceicoccales bacterium]|jgi:predicted MFS family arabinose efflux permease|nr:MFS transporter [Puniceicoccales bacterium]
MTPRDAPLRDSAPATGANDALPAAGDTAPRTALLLILTAIQFTHCLDFMIILPLGEDLMREFKITPAQFGQMTAAYSLAAAAAGFAAGFVMDRIPRHRALLVLYAGLTAATFWSALAPSFGWLVAARTITGMCGGVAASVVGAIIADAIPPWRRGRAMAWVGSAFPVAQVLGLPAGLWFAKHHGWQSPLAALGCVCLAVLVLAWFTLPPVRSTRAEAPPLRQMREILTTPLHIRCFIMSGALLFAGALVAPFMAMSMEINGGLTKDEIALMYFCGGIVVFFTTRLFGILSDRHDKLRVLAVITPFTIAAVLAITHWQRSPLWVTYIFTTLFFVTMSGRFAPAMTMVANAIEARYRGGFMSVNAAVQQTCASAAHVVAGLFLTAVPAATIAAGGDAGNAAGAAARTARLDGFGAVGVFASVMFVVSVFLAAWVRAAAPWAARNFQAPEEPAAAAR